MLPFTILCSLLSLVQGCAKDVSHFGVNPRSLQRRTAAPYPPQLTVEESILVNAFDNYSIASSSYFYTHGLHVAGTNESMAQWTADRWSENGFTSRLITYCYSFFFILQDKPLTSADVYINYPVSHSMSLSYSNGSVFTPSLEEEVLQEDPTTSYPNRVPTFHGYSASGSVTAEYVYVGRGQQV